jgi:hypothetical protein
MVPLGPNLAHSRALAGHMPGGILSTKQVAQEPGSSSSEAI